jgi:hypothetical protein
MKKTKKTFLYRVDMTDKKKDRFTHLAEVKAVLDETARRHIIHKVMEEGGQVHCIHDTDDNTRQPDERAKKNYGDA